MLSVLHYRRRGRAPQAAARYARGAGLAAVAPLGSGRRTARHTLPIEKDVLVQQVPAQVGLL